MKIDQFPAYCGGRLLWGLWDNDISPPEGWWNYMDKNWHTTSRGIGLNADGSPDVFCSYCPNDLVLFQQILRHIMRNKIGRDQCAVLIAVTSNRAQPQAIRFLEATGFTKAFTGRKSEYGNECTTWYGDMNGKVWPILSKLPEYAPPKAGKFA